MKKAIKGLTLAAILFFSFVFVEQSVYSHSGKENVNVDDVVAEILREQKVSRIEDLKCDKVSEEDFERLGEAVMSYMHPNEKEHTAMDNMMASLDSRNLVDARRARLDSQSLVDARRGGEGSESLRQAHISMGKRYLGCEEGVPGFMGMMGAMMGSFSGERGWGDMMNGYGMMGGGMYFWGLFAFLTWVLFVIFLVLGSVYFWKEIQKKRKS